MKPESIISELRRMTSDQLQEADEIVLSSIEMNEWPLRTVRKRIAKATAFLDAIDAIHILEKQGEKHATHQDD